ncbi:MAG: hypothetical protein QG650_284 [Patescibacteria group bacterium]|nr:hypothetical protein [Patescibacteria group bacterium]
MAMRVCTEKNFSGWERTETKNAAKAMADTATIARRPKTRYPTYARQTTKALRLWENNTMAVRADTHAHLTVRVGKTQKTTGKQSVAKNASELGFPRVQNALPSHQSGKVTSAATGSNPKTCAVA